jgi:hypothetical protein
MHMHTLHHPRHSHHTRHDAIFPCMCAYTPVRVRVYAYMRKCKCVRSMNTGALAASQSKQYKTAKSRRSLQTHNPPTTPNAPLSRPRPPKTPHTCSIRTKKCITQAHMNAHMSVFSRRQSTQLTAGLSLSSPISSAQTQTIL